MTRRGTVVLALLLAAAGCREGQAAARLDALPGSAPSIDALGRGVVEGFVHADTVRLRGYTLSLEEYRDVVWPRLGMDSISGMTFDWSWRDNQMRGGRAHRRYLQRMKGLPLRPVATQCTGEPQRFDGVTVIPDCTVTVRDSAGGTEQMQLFKSVVEIGGQYKIFRYDD